jgi:hypothetical protein
MSANLIDNNTLQTEFCENTSSTLKIVPQSQASNELNPPHKKNEAQAPVVGHTVWDLIQTLVPTINRPFVLLFLASILITGMVVIVLYAHPQIVHTDGGWKINFFSKEEPTAPKLSRHDKLIAIGRDLKRAYIIESIADLINIEKKNINGRNKLVVNRTITYTIFALRDISKEEKVFLESYTSDETKPLYIPGTEKETMFTNGSWNVQIELLEGETRTFSTSAIYNYNLPLANPRSALYEQIRLGSNEQFFSYPNTEDVIGEIVMRIQSNSLKLNGIGEAARRFTEKTSSEAKEATQKECNGIYSISTRWMDVLPNQEVGIYFEFRDLFPRR